jgi:hypothetical protein
MNLKLIKYHEIDKHISSQFKYFINFQLIHNF